MGKTAENAISIRSLSKRFGDKEALSNISLAIPYGSTFGFLGPNGAGKTTTIRCLMDFIRPNSGSISILGKDARLDSTELKRSIGFLSSDGQLNQNWSGDDHIKLLESIRGKSDTRAKLVRRLGLNTKAKVKTLSSGNKQKLSIVLCFVGNPRLLIMDEPTRGLDPLLQNELYTILREFVSEDKAVFLSSHNLGEVERICDSVALIRNGRIAEKKTMADIRKMKVHIISAATDGAFDERLLKALPNVEIMSANPRDITLKVKGDLNKTLRILVANHITDFSVSHVNLEDVFLEEYREQKS